MIRISQLQLPCGHTGEELQKKIRKTLHLRREDRTPDFTVVRHSVDARKKPQLFDTYTVDVRTGLGRREEEAFVRRLKNRNVTLASGRDYEAPVRGTRSPAHRPVVIGAGPAGLFCALLLAEQGLRPILLERGKRMEERTRDVERFWSEGVLDPRSNVQFGEGGAGTFSDGKLNTQVGDRSGRASFVLRTFVEAGAPAAILTEAKPHIGTDCLRTVIPNLRRRIEAAGGEIRFQARCTGFCFQDADGEVAGRRLAGIFIQDERDPGAEPAFLPADAAVLAIGHSARDTLEELFRLGIPMEQKPFAVGLRVAHPQALIDESQYGFSDPETLARLRLGPSPYKLTARASSGRGVYSFCMCPGGYIVNASSEAGRTCVNGMSDERRDSGWANSAIVVTVGTGEFGGSHVLDGLRFQRGLEEKAFALGEGSIPVQKYTDFRKEALSMEEGTAADDGTPLPAGTFRAPWARGTCRRAPLHALLPPALTRDFVEGMRQFGGKIRGFDGPEALVAGIESRTSSPVRITRGPSLESTGVRGLYPCGEGAGYAGGIMSAAMDGLRVAEAVLQS